MNMNNTYDLNALRAALEEAEKAGARGEVPIGAVLVDPETGNVLARNGNRTLELNDPTAHAEIMVIRDYCAQVGAQRIPGVDLYVTIEPCTLCAAALSFARINRVIFGASDEKGGGVINGVRFYDAPTCHHRPDVIGPVPEMERACGDIVRNFFKARR